MQVATETNPFLEILKLRRELASCHIEISNLREGIIVTLNKNRHLADGEDCSLIELKRLVPEWS
jgi:hypothetical protein